MRAVWLCDVVRVTGDKAARMAGSDCVASELNAKGFELYSVGKGKP